MAKFNWQGRIDSSSPTASPIIDFQTKYQHVPEKYSGHSTAYNIFTFCQECFILSAQEIEKTYAKPRKLITK